MLQAACSHWPAGNSPARCQTHKTCKQVGIKSLVFSLAGHLMTPRFAWQLKYKETFWQGIKIFANLSSNIYGVKFHMKIGR